MVRILHVVVGAGLPHYFQNAVRSVLSQTDDDVLGIYNQVSPRDFPSISDCAIFLNTRFRFELRKNISVGKTGSLYDSYNWAIEYAQRRYEFIHFLQSDMQLMLWPRNQIHEIQQIFESANHRENPTGKLFCLAIFAPARGYAPGFQKTLGTTARTDKVWVSRTRAMVDSGIYSLRLIEATRFRFSGGEDDVNHRLLRDGWRLEYLRQPLTAFVPWPAVVRKGQVLGIEVPITEERVQLLTLKNNPASDSLLMTGDLVWAEDFVEPVNWTCFFPYWLSDLRYWSDVRARLSACKSLGVSFWSVSGDSPTYSWRGFFRPNVRPMAGPKLLGKIFFVAAKEPVKVFLKVVIFRLLSGAGLKVPGFLKKI